MDLLQFKFDGIYDSRTFKELKNDGVNHFSFDFNPRSFNFIPEHVFLTIFEKDISETDKIFLHFTHSKDAMVLKIYHEIYKRRGNLHNVFFEFDELINEIELPSELKFYLLYSPSIFKVHSHLDKLDGFIFPYELLEKINKESKLVTFYSNFFTHFKSLDLDSKLFILKLNWNELIDFRCLDTFDFNLISFPLNSDVEICYRNIDMPKLKSNFNATKKIFKNFIQL